MARISKKQVSEMYSYMTWAYDHRRYDFLYLIRHQVPTPAMEVHADEKGKNHPIAPFSLRTSRGQKLAYDCGMQVVRWKKCIPFLAFTLRDQLRQAAQMERNTESKEFAEALAEVILVRCAEERTPNVILAFASAIEGIRVVAGYAPSKMSIRGLLTRLAANSNGALTVEWGKVNDLKKPTHIKVNLPTKDRYTEQRAEKYQGQVNDWLNERGDVMFSLHRHEDQMRAMTLAERKGIEALDREISETVRDWIKGNAVGSQVPFPGDQDLFFESDSSPQGPNPRRAMASKSSQEPDQLLLEKEDEKCTGPAPAPQPPREKTVEEIAADQTAYFWELERQWQAEQRRAMNDGKDQLDQIDYDRMLAGIEF